MKKNSSASVWLGVLLFGIMMFAFVRFGMSLGAPPQEKRVSGAFAQQDGTVQRATIGFSKTTFNYEPSVIRLQRGVPAEITLDPNIPGCLGIVISPTLNFRIESAVGKNVARFMPQHAGTFPFSCPMGMGTGKIIVE